MAEIPTFQAFSGDSWDECITFIHKVRNVAWKEGKIQDQAWMANLASIHFLGEALVWYVRLPRDVQEDWSKLQAALASRWSTSLGESRCAVCAHSPGTGPQDAAASENATTPDESGYLVRGLLRATVKGSNATYYVQGGHDGSNFTLTENVRLAVHFRFESRSSSSHLDLVSTGWYPWLAVHWVQSNPNIGQGSLDYGEISTIDPETMKSSKSSSHPFQVAKFRFLSSGEIYPVWRTGETETDLTVFTNYSTLWVSSDKEAFENRWPAEPLVRLYIQNIEE